MRRIALAVAAVMTFAGAIWLARRSADEARENPKPQTEVAVRVAAIVRTTLRAYVAAYGVVEPEPQGDRPAASASLSPAVSGVIAAVNGARGQQVARGTVLVQLDSRAADIEVEKARDALDLAEKNAARQSELLQVEGTSQKLRLEAESVLAAARGDLAAAQTRADLLRVRAPLSGTVTQLVARIGQVVDPTTIVAEIVDLDRLVVNAGVPSSEMTRLAVGQSVEIVDEAARGETSGTVDFVSPQVDSKTGTAAVRVSLPAGCGLHPGLFVKLRVVTEEHKDRLAVPVTSVVKDAEGATVVAVVDGDRAFQKRVHAGLRDGDLVEVEADGLVPGQRVVTEGAYALPKETKVRFLGE